MIDLGLASRCTWQILRHRKNLSYCQLTNLSWGAYITAKRSLPVCPKAAQSQMKWTARSSAGPCKLYIHHYPLDPMDQPLAARLAVFCRARKGIWRRTWEVCRRESSSDGKSASAHCGKKNGNFTERVSHSVTNPAAGSIRTNIDSDPVLASWSVQCFSEYR